VNREGSPRIRIRPYRPTDDAQVVDVYRDAYEVLRASRGGRHADHIVDRIQGMTDAALLRRLRDGYHLVVAEDEETGRLLGIGAVSDRPLDRLLQSARSKSHYVRLGMQGGRGGVGLGTLLRNATLGRARELGHRKVWGYAQPESRGWHAKFGARFHPFHDTYNPEHSLTVSYYDIELRPSFWNRIRVEPCLFRLGKLLPTIAARVRDRRARSAGDAIDD
jgi:L-amino acid N-acyltransferase YncA